MNNELNNFMHLARRSNSFRYGAPYLVKENAKKIKLIIIMSSASANLAKQVHNFGTFYKIPVLEINEQTITSFIKQVNAKVISVLNLQIARKLTTLRKEGGDDEKR